MTLIKTSLLNGIAVVIKMLTLLGINKILAIYVGPAGYAALGQFQNAIQMITTFASGAVNTGVTKYTAEYYEDEKKQRTVWGTAGTISVIGSVLTGLLVIFFRKPLAGWFLKDESYSDVFFWFAVTLIFFVFNTLLLAILNGKKEIHRYVIANIAGSLFSLLVTSFMAIQYGLYGALVALAIYQSLAFFVTFLLCYQASWFKLSYMFGGIEKDSAKNLAKYTAMALTSAACVPVSHIIIRNYLGETLGWDAAGYWEAMWRLSAAYLMMITTTLTVYYLPRFSELSNFSDVKNEVASGLKFLLPASVLLCLFIYYFQDIIVKILFSDDFSGMKELFHFQLIGDFLKITSWIFGFVFVSKSKFKLYMFIEIYFSMQFVMLTIFLIDSIGFRGVALAHTINYAICLFFVILVFYRGRWNAN